MKKSILNLEGVQVLSRNEQKGVNGGLKTWCYRRSTNVIDLRPGASAPDVGWLNANGCWIYPGMSPFSDPNCPPGTACYFLNGGN